MYDDDDDDDDRPRPRGRWVRGLLFVSSAAMFALLVRSSFRHPWIGLVMFAAATAYLGWRWWKKTRVVRMLRRGDVEEILAHWSNSLDTIPHAETMAPLMTATAFAAYGRVEDARRALATAARGPAWDAALEHRLFLDTILSTFEGESEQARELAQRLNSLPMPNNDEIRDRVSTLRQAVAAMVRAFEHRSDVGDVARLEAASEKSPLVHWAMRYAAAIVAIDHGMREKARELIDKAPRWPEESAFRSFHEEISGVLG
ncbi:MAG: hypothetical protein U0271_24185 [Polyangiaceae bacterium]